MGIYDRNYMKEKREEPQIRPRINLRQPAERAPLWSRIKFRIWLWFHPRG